MRRRSNFYPFRGISTDTPRKIASCAFPDQDFEKKPEGLSLVCEQMYFLPTAAADPTPAPQKRCVSEQCRLYGQHIVACHVSLGIDTFHVKVVLLGDHGTSIVGVDSGVQRDF